MTTRIEGPMGTTSYAEHEVETGPTAEPWLEGARPFMEALLFYGFFHSWDDKAILRPSGSDGPVLFRVLLTPVGTRGICGAAACDPHVKEAFGELAAVRPEVKEAFARWKIDI